VTGALDLVGFSVLMADDQTALTPVVELPRWSIEQQRTTGDGLQILVWLSQA